MRVRILATLFTFAFAAAAIVIFATAPPSSRLLTSALFLAGTILAVLQLLPRGRATAPAPVLAPSPPVPGPHPLGIERGRGPRTYVVPSELPPSPLFVGRTVELERAMAGILNRQGSGPSILAVYGDPGIGKTAFAITAAHRAASSFPDGALFATLGGRPDNRDAISAVLGDFVDSLQGPEDVPEGFAERRARFEELTGDAMRNRVLIVLDDALSEEQVLPLLPAGAGGAVLVTARRRLDIGATAEIILDTLRDSEAEDLLAALIGEERLSRERAAAGAIVERAGGYPLALQLAGSSLSSRRTWSLQTAVETMSLLAPTGSTSAEDRALDFTYALLTADERDAIRAIGLLETQTFAPWMIAAMLTATPGNEPPAREQVAWRLCERLVDLRLVEHLTDDATGVASFRVLEHVRNYARARVQLEWDAPVRAAAATALRLYQADRGQDDLRTILRQRVYRGLEQGRLLRALNHARGAIDRARDELNSARTAAAMEPESTEIRRWLDHAREDQGLALAALAEVLGELGGVEDTLEVVAKALEDPTPLARPRALRTRGRMQRRLRRFDEATRTLSEALVAAENDPAEQVRIMRELTMVQASAGRTGAAVSTLERAFVLARTADLDRRLRASLLWAQAVVQRDAVRRGASTELLQEADRALREANRVAEARRQQLWRAWAGYERAQVMRALGHQDICRALALRALEEFTEMRHRYGTARCRLEIGRSYLDQGRPADALPVLEEARETFSTCGDRWIEGETARELAQAQLAVQRPASAERELLVALERYGDTGDEARRAEVYRQLADVRRTLAPKPGSITPAVDLGPVMTT